MCNSATTQCLSVDTTVRLLLAGAMALVLAVLVLVSSHRPADAQSATRSYELSREQIVAALSESYQETPVAGGIAADGSFLEVFAAPDGRSWTIIVTRPDGRSRVVAEGEGWAFLSALQGQRI